MHGRNLIIVLTIALTVSFFTIPQPEARAIDPVTMAILAPIAMQVAKATAPYIFKAMGNMLKVMLRAGVDLLEFMLLPIGLLECIFLFRWRFRAGLQHMKVGAFALVKFMGRVLILPLSPLGVGTHSWD